MLRVDAGTVRILTDHIQAETPLDAATWLAAVALWLAGVAILIYRKLRTTR